MVFLRRFQLPILIVAMILLLGIIRAGAQSDVLSSEGDTLVYEENYPEDIDLLEEIIQSYYLLLDSQSIVEQYPMLHESANLIENDSLAMRGFYSKLAELRNGQKDRVTILQIGDSHIQPGYFSGTARASLQRYFGNAGRGLVFPWRLARTNQPDDIKITSNSLWQRSSNEVGICGYGLQAQAEGNLNIQTNNFFQKDNTFDQVTLIMKEQENSYTWNVAGMEDDLTTAVSSFADQSIYQLSWMSPVRQADLSFKASDPSDKANLYGIILERQQPGLMYHAMGMNGASFDSFSKIAEFFPQMRILNPDLIVISLGTNDTQGRFREEVYLRTVKQFMKHLSKAVPRVPVLFTFPPDSNKNGRTNQDITKANDLLKKYARDNNYAWWNLQEVMGGTNSIRKWVNLGLARGDMKHFTPKGYMLQGHLFNQALVKGYKNYAEHK